MKKAHSMGTFFDYFPYPILVPLAVLMLLLPFQPMPHALEKLLMLKNGTLNRPIDIFDLVFHTLPTIILIMKIIRDVLK